MTDTANPRAADELPLGVDLDLAVALATGLTRVAAGERAGVSRATVDRRLRDPQFRLTVLELLNDRRDQLLASSIEAATLANAFLIRVLIGQEEGATLAHRIRVATVLRGPGVLALKPGEP